MRLNPFRKESLKRYSGIDKHSAKTFGVFGLLTIGTDTVIGTGIFILPGTVAAKETSPGVTLSFLMAALVCTLASMRCAELSSNTLIAGSAHSYRNILYRGVVGWTLGWTLIPEYILSIAAVSAGWASYFNSLLHNFGLYTLRHFKGPFDPLNGTYLNLWTVTSALLIGILPSRGMKTSTRFNNVAVPIKIAIIFVFIDVGLFLIKPKNYHPFTPYGTTGVLWSATTVFFAFLGFDVVPSSAIEAKNPKKNMPIGIIGTLVVAALLYMGASVVLTGMINYKQLDVANPVVYALKLVNQGWIADFLSIGVIMGIGTMMLTMIYSSSRLIYSVGRDGPLSNFLGKIDKYDFPENVLWTVTIVIALMGGLFSLEESTNLIPIETLPTSAFASFGVILLRRRKDIPEGNSKVPLYPVIPVLFRLTCIGVMCSLLVRTYLFVGIWFLFGLFIYRVHGYKHNKINKRDN